MTAPDARFPARFCILTPDGRGAIAVIRVWGPRALELANAVFRPKLGPSLAASPPGRLRFGRIGSGQGDEVVAVIVEADPPEVEVHCHGGPAALDLVANSLEAVGVERRQPVAWVRHASRSAIAAEAEVDLARATTVRAAEILLEQAQGALEAEVRSILGQLAPRPVTAIDPLERLLQRSEVGLKLVPGWRVVLAGRPNVGKSRLLNALAGFDRAIVDPTPGTTRDVVTARVALEGWPIELADTAGLRTSDDPVETSGIERARQRHERADLVLLVIDRSEPLTESDQRLLEEYPTALVAASKCDLPPAWRPDRPTVREVSAERGTGIVDLGAAIVCRLIAAPPPAGAGVPFRPGQVRHLVTALEALRSGDAPGAEQTLRMMLASLPRT